MGSIPTKDVIRKVVFILARPRKNSQALQGAYTKEEMKKRLEAESVLKGSNNNLNPPDFILKDEIALAKFNQLIKELKEVDLVNNVDVDLLSVYSNCWSNYVRSTKILAMQDLVEEQENKNGMIVKVQNPYIKTQNVYSDKLIKLSSLFGLSPADRSKVAHLNPSDKTEQSDPLLDLLKGLNGNG